LNQETPKKLVFDLPEKLIEFDLLLELAAKTAKKVCQERKARR